MAFATLSFNSWFGVVRTPESRGKRVPKVVPFFVPFGAVLGPKMDPQFVPTFVQNLLIFGVHLWIAFLEVLELLGCLLGAFLGLLKLSWEAYGPQKPVKTMGFQGFWKCSFLDL